MTPEEAAAWLEWNWGTADEDDLYPVVEVLIDHARATAEPEIVTAAVILFKPSGKYYTEERWQVPDNATGPYDMNQSPNFRRISGGAVLVPTQEPWGYPHLIPEVTS